MRPHSKRPSTPVRASPAPPASLLTTTRKALYATINLGVGGFEFIVAVFLLKYYTDYTGLEAGLAGTALLLGKVFDAVSDPIMGYISDRTKSRWGRRRPWFFIGALPLSVGFVGMFSADPAWSQSQLFLWLLATNILFWTGTTMVLVPHAAFASELTGTHEERISIMGWREGFMAVGLVAGGLAMFLLLEQAAEYGAAAATASGLAEAAVAEAARIARGSAHGTITLWLGLILCIFATITFIGTRERSGPHTPPRDTLFGDFADTFRSRPFLLYAVALVIGQVAEGLTASLALFTIEEWWGFESAHPRFIMVGYMVMAMVTIPLWMRIARRFDKAHMLAVGALMGMIALIGMFFVPYMGLWWAYATFYFAGVGLGGRMVMGIAIVPDIIDDDELRTHTRKDGAYFGVLSLLRKLSRSLAIGFSGVGLGLFGYVSGVAEQSPEALWGIKVMFCIVPAAASGITALMLLWFPITRARHELTFAELNQRHADRAASVARRTRPTTRSPRS